jgi:hypothetical protein
LALNGAGVAVAGSISRGEREKLDDRWANFLRDPASVLTLEKFQERLK